MIQYIKFGQNPSFGSGDRVQTSFFWSKYGFKVLVWHWKWGQRQSHQYLKVTKILSFLSYVSVMFLCKFGQNPPIGSGDRVRTRLIFTVFIVWWPWKWGQGHQNLINSFKYPNDKIHKVWPNPLFGSRDRDLRVPTLRRTKFPDISLTFLWHKFKVPWQYWSQKFHELSTKDTPRPNT